VRDEIDTRDARSSEDLRRAFGVLTRVERAVLGQLTSTRKSYTSETFIICASEAAPGCVTPPETSTGKKVVRASSAA
jgi:hypothetical protein